MNRRLKVCVVFNDDGELAAGSAQDALAVAGVEGAVRSIVEALTARGFEAHAMAAPKATRDVLPFVAQLDCDVVFNQVESLGGDARREAHFAAALELRGLSYTGCTPRAMTLCLDKPLARAVLAAHGVPIARGAVLHDGSESLAGLSFPVMVKPSREDASHGIALESVSRGETSARIRACLVIKLYAQPALVEEYYAGREFNVALLEGEKPGAAPRVLSLSEIDFTNFPADAPRIVTYGAKWIEGSPEWKGTRSIAAAVEVELAERIRAAAVGAWRALGLSGYARVDLRATEEPVPRLAVIDVNANPDLSRDAGFALTAGRSGISYDQLIESILESALRADAARA